MKSETVSEINADVITANGDDAVAVAGTEAGVDVATAADPGAAAVRILKTATCPSLSGKSKLTYNIGCNTAGEIGFCIVLNSGGGLFNKEWIPQSSIQPLLDKIPKGNPVRSSTFLPIFQGKSVNTAGFLTALLLQEKLLQPLADKPRCYELLDPEPFVAAVNALLVLPEGKPVRSKAQKARNQ